MFFMVQVDILRDTVMGALNAALPIGTRRTIYLCDDLPGVVMTRSGLTAIKRPVALWGMMGLAAYPPHQAPVAQC
jgi:hypothetical protein